MTETTYLITAFVDTEFEMFRVAKLVDGKPADIVQYAKSGTDLLDILKK